MKYLLIRSCSLLSFLLLIVTILLFQAALIISAENESLDDYDLLRCPANVTFNYTAGSQFESNLKDLLLPSLIANGAVNGFFNTSSGEDPDTVYGLAQCRGDLPSSECKACLNSTVYFYLIQLCPNKKQATVRLDNCVLQYREHRFFSQPDYEFKVSYYWNAEPAVSDLDSFNEKLGDFMTTLIETASSDVSRYRDLSAGNRSDDLRNMYFLVQCTEDLSSTDCSECLHAMFEHGTKRNPGKKDVMVVSASCQTWYRYGVSFIKPSRRKQLPPPPLPAPPPPLRLAPPPPLDSTTSNVQGDENKNRSGQQNSNTRIYMVAIPATILALVITVGICFCLLRRKSRKQKARMLQLDEKANDLSDSSEHNEVQVDGVDVPFFDLQTILAATNNFSDSNKLGQGGFGPVYKGTFKDTDMAVKRLCKSSGQGLEEFKTEVILIAKLQHRNLVRLLGYCMKGEEQILLYEYMPNKSLDSFIFDPTLCLLLNWEKRLNIILGTARGVLYLHQDSRLRIIHRDLKTSNILLDEDMNPKVSDFGLARIVGGTETEGNTQRVVGTYGYMSPEYALDGIFSVKSDVYSFGVILLEILSGKKITGIYNLEESLSLIGVAWKLWNEAKAVEFVDSSLREACNVGEVLKCIHVGLLCVQEDANDRPTMSNVILMLSGESISLPTPKHPAFLYRKYNNSISIISTSSYGPQSCSTNEMTSTSEL